MPWSAVAAAATTYVLTDTFGPAGGGGAGGQGGSGSQAQQAADPFSPYRANLGAAYSNMLTGATPTDVTKMPGYTQFQTGVLDPALEASKRSASASGMLRSGNEQMALQGVAQKGYYGFMTDYLNRLAQGSGAVNNPATAAALGVNQGNLNDAATMQMAGALGTAGGSLVKQYMNSNNGFTDSGGWANGGNGQIDVNGYTGNVSDYFAPQPATTTYITT